MSCYWEATALEEGVQAVTLYHQQVCRFLQHLVTQLETIVHPAEHNPRRSYRVVLMALLDGLHRKGNLCEDALGSLQVRTRLVGCQTLDVVHVTHKVALCNTSSVPLNI